ncbi:MAG: TonB-dependent receptor [Bacteroidales bacterium]|jgi:TonB-linked SusC/RagA family outer membrane protein|nr:TonB-dependent receptor [Bacteroidales bacterium]
MRHYLQLIFAAVIMLFASVAFASAQNRITARGVILDANGEAVIGASVLEKGNQTNGVMADLDGSFTLTVPSGATLVISSIGYVTQEVVAASNLRIVLQDDAEMLEDVVVVGYGVQRKESLTGAVTAITSEDIETTKSENFINNLQGKMPGLLIRQKTGEPGTFDNMISIRGYGTPLVVIDGVTRNGTEDLSQLASEDIESVSILKDASAAIYGLNAANGVIIVTTKQGKNERARVSYNNTLGFKNPTGFERTTDALSYYELKNEMDRNVGKTPSYSEEFLAKYRSGQAGYTDHDWLDMYMKEYAFQQNHNLTVRGGSETARYFVSLGYNEDNGLLRSGIQYFKRYNFRTNLTADLTKNLQLAVNINGRWTEQRQPREDFMWTYKTLLVNERGVGPFAIDANGNEIPGHYSYIQPEGKNAAALVDPEADGYRRTRSLNYQTSMELRYTAPFLQGLTLSAMVSYDGSNTNYDSLQKSYQLYDYYTDAKSSVFGSDSYSNTLRLYQKIYGRVQANYTKKIQDHTITATLVGEASATRNDNLSGGRQYAGLYTHDIIDMGNSSTASNSGSRSFSRLAAYLGRLNYDYKGKYLLEAVARYDGSYRYAPAKRWAFFPSVSAGWRVSEEPWMKSLVPALNNLKLRVSYGKSGMDTGSAWQYIRAYSASANDGYTFDGTSLTPGMTAPGVVNDNLTWVTSIISNLGVDFELWRGKLGGTAELFQRKNEGTLGNSLAVIPNTFGASFPQENLYSNKNFGFELSLYHTNQVNRDFSYTLSGNFTYARNMNLHVTNNEPTSQFNTWTSRTENRYQGYTWFFDYDGQFTDIAEYETAPLYGGANGNSLMLPGSYRLVDLNGDGRISNDDRRVQKWNRGTNPPIQYGFNVTLNYKQFDLSMNWQGASGYYVQYSNNDIWGYGRYPSTYAKFQDRWHTANVTDDPFNPATNWVSGFYPALKTYGHAGTYDMGNNGGTGNTMIDIWNPDATYLRLKTLELGYTVPKTVLSHIGISSARIYLNGFNLLTFCNKLLKQADPEREERDWSAGLAYPLMRSYNIGVNITF